MVPSTNRTGRRSFKAEMRVQIPQGSPRQKKPAPYRFRGLRKRIPPREERAVFKACRESSLSAVSFFLFQIGPAPPGSDLERGFSGLV